MNYKIGELTSQRAGFEPTIMGRQCVNIVDRQVSPATANKNIW